MATTNIDTPIRTQGHFKITNLGVFIKNIVNVALIAAAILCLFYMLWGAVEWIISQGDKAKYEAARNKITSALIGLAVTACSWLLWLLALYFLGVGNIDLPKNSVDFRLQEGEPPTTQTNTPGPDP